MASGGQDAVYSSLKDAIIVISGGATGIGGAMTEAFARQGSQVIMLDIQDKAAAELISSLKDAGVAHEPEYHRCNVMNIEGAVKPVAAQILERYSQIHGLINNAANDVRQPTLEITPQMWDDSMTVNLRHQFFLTQALLPGLKASGSSSVINMGSISWAIPAVGLVPYVASKSAIVGLTKTLAHEFGKDGVRVNSIMPGAVATEKQKLLHHTGDYVQEILSRQALKKILQPNEIASVAMFLASKESSGITNQSIVVDAGWV